ncbi:MAG: hotdog domain-containing protein [Gemmataceae bacterium]
MGITLNEPYVALQTVMMPRDENPQGTIFGGVILGLIDMAGHTGAKHIVIQSGGQVPVLVTVALNRVEFKLPVLVGDVVRCLVSLVKMGKTSVTVRVAVEAERDAQTLRVTEAEVVYVGIDPTSPERRTKQLL